LFASEAKLSPFFDSTVWNPIRSLLGRQANASANESALPTGTRTKNESLGGVIPRRTCGFSSWTDESFSDAAWATAANGVDGPTRTESYAYGARWPIFIP